MPATSNVLHSKLQEQIARLQEIADRKASQMEKSNFKKYGTIFDQLVRFLKRKNVLLYGGTAINELLPKKLKFYGPHTLPDIDVFTTNGTKLAADIVAYFRRHGREFTSGSEALHPGTYKIFTDGIQVLDITTLSREAFARLSKRGVRLSNGLKTADPDFLRMTLHVMLSQPKDSHRWSKVLQRVIAFYDVYPPDARCHKALEAQVVDPEKYGHLDLDKFLAAASKWLAGRDYVMFGTDMVVRLLRLSPKLAKMLPTTQPALYKDVPPIAVLSENVDNTSVEVAEECLKYLSAQAGSGQAGSGQTGNGKVPKPKPKTNASASFRSANELHVETYPADEFLPAHTIIVDGVTKQPLIAVYETPACVSYVEYNGYRIASMHTFIRMLMSHEFSAHKHAQKAANAFRCFTNLLMLLMLETIDGSKKRALQQFVIHCYGVQPGLATLRRERLRRHQENSNSNSSTVSH